ncbi:hypothetical protein B7494_g3678 [Chlorociboria aeruginascens]|nr:hypothetical protein B7494_g3678 [Chlorociboria aeruginascens]
MEYPAPYHAMLGDEIIAIIVGPKRKRFTMHKNLLCRRSPFFERKIEAYIASQQAEREIKHEEKPYVYEVYVEGTDRTCTAFAYLVDCLYRNLISKSIITTPLVTIDFYHLCARFSMTDMMNRLMDELLNLLLYKNDTRFFTSFEVVSEIYSHPECNSNNQCSKYIKSFIVAAIALRIGRGEKDDDWKQWNEKATDFLERNPEFAKQLVKLEFEYGHEIKAFMEGTIGPPAFLNQCNFHAHTVGQVCHLTKARVTADKATWMEENTGFVRSPVKIHFLLSLCQEQLISGDEIVSITISNERKRFTVHRKILCNHSPWFKLNIEALDTCDAGVRERGTRAQVYKLHISGNLGDCIVRQHLTDRLYWRILKENMTASPRITMDLYCLAERFNLKDFMNTIMDSLHRFY